MSLEPKEVLDPDFTNGRLRKTTKRWASCNSYAFAIFGIGTCFVVWASLFIYKSSFVGIDGRRYFCLIDDAMISMRYAWNLSHGSGLVWNPGEYVEGYTNPLMTLLMSLPSLVFDKVDAVLAIQVLGIVFMLVNAYLIMSIAEHLVSGQERYRRLFLVLAFLCALSYYPLVYWTLMGMETGLLTVLLSLSVLSALRYAADQRPVHGVLALRFPGLGVPYQAGHGWFWPFRSSSTHFSPRASRSAARACPSCSRWSVCTLPLSQGKNYSAGTTTANGCPTPTPLR